MLTVPNGELIRVPLLTPQFTVCPVVRATTAKRRGRVVMFSGLGGQGAILQSGNAGYAPLVTNLIADGWECWEIYRPATQVDQGGQDEGYFDIRDDPAFGARFKATNVQYFDDAMAMIEGSNGKLPTIFGGVSMGAWSSIVWAMSGKHKPIGIWGMCPPNVFSLVWIYAVIQHPYLGLTTTGVDLPSTALNGLGVPAYIEYCDQDSFVQPELTAAMVQTARANGETLALGRQATDAVITGGTNYSSATCGLAMAESGCPITGPGIPGGTTLTVTSSALPNAGPYTGTLSQACTNGSGLTVTFPTLGPIAHHDHGVDAGGVDLGALFSWIQATFDGSYPEIW